ncbi:MAG TPA: hypothetical protein DDZ83_18265 [Nitrospinae bacterium]|nr:hypothetical protein [Nitrospinota bacterium]
MPNIPFLSLDSSENIGSSMGAAPFSSGSDREAFDSLLREAGSAIEESSAEPERSDSVPVSRKSTDEPAPDSSETAPENDDVAAVSGENSNDSGDDVAAVPGENSNDSGEVDSGEGRESSSESGEESKTPAALEEPSADGQGPANNVQTAVVGPMAMIFVQNMNPAPLAGTGGGETSEAPGASLQGVPLISTSSGVSADGGEASPGGSAPRKAVAPSRPGNVQFALDGEAETAARSATPAPGTQKTEVIPAAPVVPADAAVIQAKPLQGAPAEGEAAVSVPTPIPNAGQTGVSAPSELNANINAVSLAAGTAPEVVGAQVQPDGVPVQPNVAPAEPGQEMGKANPEADFKNSQLIRTDIDASAPVNPAQAEGAGAVRDEGVVLQKTDAPLEGIAGRGEADSLSARLDGAADSQATAPQAGSRAESILKLQVQRQLLEATVSRLKIALRDGVAQARIRLNPPSLGRMEIRLQVESHTLNARVTVESAWVKDAVMSNLRELRETLQEQGVEVEQFTVDIDAGTNGKKSSGGFEGGAFGDEFLSMPGPNGEVELAAIQAEDAIAPGPVGSGGAGSVDFFA